MVLTALGLLCLPAILPVVAIAGLRPVSLFLVPLGGAALAAISAIFVFAVIGSVAVWFAIFAVLANVGACTGILSRLRNRRRASVSGINGRSEEHRPVRGHPEATVWKIACTVVVVLAVAWPLMVLRVPVIGYDAQAIWLLHTALVWGGHQVMVAGLTNPVYRVSNPDYPPLVPGAGALAYTSIGHINERVAVDITVVLNACALGVVGTGLLQIVPTTVTRVRRVAALLVVFIFCGAAFGIAGTFGVSGYADMLWSVAALGATVYGLVLPRNAQGLLIAWLCIVVASLTKNEGTISCVFISLLIAARYIGWQMARRGGPARGHSGRPVGINLTRWVRFLVMASIPMIPAVLWVGAVRLHGIQNSFFAGGSSQSPAFRLATASIGMSHYLYIALAALVVLALGGLTLRTRRSDLRLANSLWLWVVVLAVLAVILATYVAGSYEIHWWLSTSASRTTIFAQTAMLSDMTIWALVLICVAGQSERSGSDAELPSEPVHQPERDRPTNPIYTGITLK